MATGTGDGDVVVLSVVVDAMGLDSVGEVDEVVPEVVVVELT